MANELPSDERAGNTIFDHYWSDVRIPRGGVASAQRALLAARPVVLDAASVAADGDLAICAECLIVKGRPALRTPRRRRCFSWARTAAGRPGS